MPTQPLIRREFTSFKRKLMVFASIISLGCAGGLYATKTESAHRVQQFCSLTVARANDNVTHFDQTVEYLATPAGLEKTGINDIIRKRSAPMLADTVTFDKQHRVDTCLSISPTYKNTKYPAELKSYATQKQQP